jgi:hypothetical protein
MYPTRLVHSWGCLFVVDVGALRDRGAHPVTTLMWPLHLRTHTRGLPPQAGFGDIKASHLKRAHVKKTKFSEGRAMARKVLEQ